MKKMIFLFGVLFVFIGNLVLAQSYNTVVGMRMGTEWGITAKQRITDHSTIEGIVNTDLSLEKVKLTALFERHYPLISNRLNVYFGAGVHKTWEENIETLNVGGPIGFSAIGGAEFTVGRFNVSWDFLPSMDLYHGNKFSTQSAVSVRYVLWKREKKSKKFFEDEKWKFWKKDEKKKKKR